MNNIGPHKLCLVIISIISLFGCTFCQCSFDEGTLVLYPGQSSDHQTGKANGNAWVVTTADPQNSYLTYGPNQTAISSNASRVDFLLSINDNNMANQEVLIVDVYDADSQQSLIQKSINVSDFETANMPQNFTLFFSNTGCSKSIAFRIFYKCCANITHYQTAVRNLDEGKFGAFWNMQSHFQFVSETNLSVAGVFILPLNGVWYVFHREQGYQPTPSYCTSVIPAYRILVRTSTDQGRTYSDPVVVAQPVPNTPSECALVDGSPFYDNETNTWHYLSQCIARTGGWNLCHYYLQGSSPVALFNIDNNNPVVKGGQLFSQICAGSGKHCTETTVDEGTPDIVKKENGNFYVTFHGFDYADAKGYRGVAMTPDFVKWSVNSYDMPDDAIFSPIDCQQWNVSWSPKNGGCIGSGEGTIMLSGDYYYQIIEAADITLICITTTDVQNWVLGIVRSPYFSPSGTWEEFKVNPTVVPLIKAGCSLQYHRLFYDSSDGNIYLSYIIEDFETGVALMKVNVLQPVYENLPIVATAP